MGSGFKDNDDDETYIPKYTYISIESSSMSVSKSSTNSQPSQTTRPTGKKSNS